MRQFFLIQISLLLCLALHSQDINQSYLVNQTGDSLVQGSIRLKLGNNNFLRNNEYFDPYTEGITYFGSQLQPEISYSFSNNTRLSIGYFLRFYYGKDKFNTSLPVIRFEYLPLPTLKVTFGQLNGLLGHKLLEPIYSTDNYFKRNPENGIEISLNRSRIQSEIWISWEHFILPGDNTKEEISAGMHSSWLLLKNRNIGDLKICLQGIIHHFGGQVDASDLPLQTRLNLAPGLEYDFQPFNSNKSNLVLGSYLIQSVDQSSTGTLPYKKGWASYSYLTFTYKPLTLVASWFHGEYYFAPLGDYLFQSVSELNDWYTTDKRNLLNGKFLFDHQITGGIKLGARFEAYYEPATSHLNFSYGMNIQVDADWLLFRNGRKK